MNWFEFLWKTFLQWHSHSENHFELLMTSTAHFVTFCLFQLYFFNSFQANVLFLYPLKSSEKRFSGALCGSCVAKEVKSIFYTFVAFLRVNANLSNLEKICLTQFSPVVHFIWKPAIRFAMQIKWLVSMWNAALD